MTKKSKAVRIIHTVGRQKASQQLSICLTVRAIMYLIRRVYYMRYQQKTSYGWRSLLRHNIEIVDGLVSVMHTLVGRSYIVCSQPS